MLERIGAATAVAAAVTIAVMALLAIAVALASVVPLWVAGAVFFVVFVGALLVDLVTEQREPPE